MRSAAEHTRTTILVDVTHGLDAGHEALEGAALASLNLDTPLCVVGDEPRITRALQEIPHDAELLRVIHAEDAEHGGGLRTTLEHAAALPCSTVVTAAARYRVLQDARDILPLLPGVTRPALAAVYPTVRLRGERDDPFALLLDVGAQLDSTAPVLLEHAILGAVYARLISENETPRVALLANTSQEDAIPPRLAEAAALLAEAAGERFTFAGLTDGSRILLGDADVVVSDGYSGELLIRTIEGFAATAEQLLARAGKRFRWRMGVSMLGGGIEALRELTDWQNYGGAPLLGLARPVITLQSGARRRAFVNAARLAAKIDRLDVQRALDDATRDTPR
ncbi:MAG: phosphate acyltransferase PlsX [Deltaproteobacteria bacterium]|nr:MAG: phosphate acyltransferase PlsX [Deltaproteobacteria bacterium]